MSIRPVVQALIDRGNVQIDEIEHLGCSQEEAVALIPALADSALARRLDRVLTNIKLPQPETSPDWTLYLVAQSAMKGLERQTSSGYSAFLSAGLTSALAGVTPPTEVSYRLALFQLATEAQKRFSVRANS